MPREVCRMGLCFWTELEAPGQARKSPRRDLEGVQGRAQGPHLPFAHIVSLLEATTPLSARRDARIGKITKISRARYVSFVRRRAILRGITSRRRWTLEIKEQVEQKEIKEQRRWAQRRRKRRRSCQRREGKNQRGRGGKDDSKGRGRGHGNDQGKNDRWEPPRPCNPVPNNQKTETCPHGTRCFALRDYGHCPKWHEPWEEQEAQQRRRALKAEQIAANAWNNKGAGGGAGRGGRQGRGRDGRGRGGGGKDGGGKENEANPPEVETANTVAGAKAEPRPKGRKLTTGGSESWTVIEEEVYSFAEQLTYCGSSVKRVPGIMELRDFFLTVHETRDEVETEAELCCSIESVPVSLPGPSSGGGLTDLSEFVDRLLAVNPNFGVITRLKDLDESNFVERKLQRPVGHSATTRVHM